MEYKYIKVNLDKFEIKYDGTQFSDIHEFIIDLRNIFSHMQGIYKKFKKIENTVADETKAEKLTSLMNEELKNLQNELQNRLDYITDSDMVSETLVQEARGKLMQLKSLNRSIDTTKDPGHNIARLVNFYNTRVLEKELAITREVYSHR